MSALSGTRFPDPQAAEPVETPCIGICHMDQVLDICKGCGRTINEIAEWTQIAASERSEIMAELPDRMAGRIRV